MIKTGYLNLIDEAETLDQLDTIVEAAANNFYITNAEYAEVYEYSLKKVRSWSCVCV